MAKFRACTIPTLAALTAALLMAGGMGCAEPRANESPRGNQPGTNATAEATADLAALANDLRATDAGTRSAAIATTQSLDDRAARRLLELVRESAEPVPTEVGETLGEAASQAGKHRTAAEWFALPVPDDSPKSRGRRLVKTVRELMAAREFFIALQLAEIRLAGPYPSDIETELDSLRRQAERESRTEN